MYVHPKRGSQHISSSLPLGPQSEWYVAASLPCHMNCSASALPRYVAESGGIESVRGESGAVDDGCDFVALGFP